MAAVSPRIVASVQPHLYLTYLYLIYSGEIIMSKLVSGYRRFRSEVYPLHKHRFRSLANGQRPHTLFITCSDSRVVPSLITQSDPGELFICGVVGNLVPAHGVAFGGVSSAIEYAVTVLGVDDIVICGHSDCGAMRAFMHPEKLRSLRAVESWLEHASCAIAVTRHSHGHLPDDAFVDALIRENIVSQLQHLKTHPSVATRLRGGTLRIHGWLYDIGSGTVTRFDELTGRFVSLESSVEEEAAPAIA
jgi:carbonic anhydrase